MLSDMISLDLNAVQFICPYHGKVLGLHLSLTLFLQSLSLCTMLLMSNVFSRLLVPFTSRRMSCRPIKKVILFMNLNAENAAAGMSVGPPSGWAREFDSMYLSISYLLNRDHYARLVEGPRSILSGIISRQLPSTFLTTPLVAPLILTRLLRFSMFLNLNLFMPLKSWRPCSLEIAYLISVFIKCLLVLCSCFWLPLHLASRKSWFKICT